MNISLFTPSLAFFKHLVLSVLYVLSEILYWSMPRTISSRIVGQILKRTEVLNGKLGMWDDRAGPEVHRRFLGFWASLSQGRRLIIPLNAEYDRPCLSAIHLVSCARACRLARASVPLSRCLFNTIISHRSTCVRMTVGASLAGRTFRIPSVTQACAARISIKVGGNARIDAERRSFGLRHECVGSRSQASQGWEVTQCRRTRPCYLCIVGIFPNPYKPLRYCPVYFPYQSDSLIP